MMHLLRPARAAITSQTGSCGEARRSIPASRLEYPLNLPRAGATTARPWSERANPGPGGSVGLTDTPQPMASAARDAFVNLRQERLARCRHSALGNVPRYQTG